MDDFTRSMGVQDKEYYDKVTKKELVHQPTHYTAGGIETIDFLKAKLTPEEYRGYIKGNILKYLSRANFKGSHDTDMLKVAEYATYLS
jgi:hypothetical protein